MKGEREAGKRLWKVFPAKLVRPAFQPQQREEQEALMARSGLWDKNKLHAEALCHPPSPAHTLWAAGLTPNPDSSSHFSSGPPHRPPDLKSRGQNSPISGAGGPHFAPRDGAKLRGTAGSKAPLKWAGPEAVNSFHHTHARASTHAHTRMHALMCTCTHAHSEAILVAAALSHQYTTLTEHGSWVLRTNALVPGFPTRLPYASELAAATPTDPGLLPSLPISKALDSSAPSGRAGCPTACLGLQN